jgi:hypothetical protein
MPDEPSQSVPPWRLPTEASGSAEAEPPQQLIGTKFLIAILIVVIIGVGGWWLWNRVQPLEGGSKTKCQENEMVFYYRETCPACQKVFSEGTISKVENLGIKKFDKIEVTVGPIEHEFDRVPTFVINEKIYQGYRTFEELKELLGC